MHLRHKSYCIKIRYPKSLDEHKLTKKNGNYFEAEREKLDVCEKSLMD
jgi:hypothetical protein